MENGSRGA